MTPTLVMQFLILRFGEHRRFIERPLCAMSGRCRQTDARARGPSAIACSAAIPGRPDRRPRPARAEAAAIVATAVKARPAEIVPVAIVPVITGDWIDIPGAPVVTRHARNRSFVGISWKGVIRWLLIARQEAVAVPTWRRAFMSGRSRRDGRQQRQDDNNRQKHKAGHKHTIDGRLLGGDSNLSAQSSATAHDSLAKRTLCASSGHPMTDKRSCLFLSAAAGPSGPLLQQH